MTAINELLDNLLKYSYQLSCLNMRQVAADYDYFATWIQSKDPINPSKHYGVAPAGENTIAPLAYNCPIPFTQTIQLVNNCTNKEFAVAYTSLINEILLTLKDVYTSNEEVTAINEYIKYTNNVISLLNNGSVVPPTPPAPSEILGYTTSSGAASVQNVSVNNKSTRQLFNAQGSYFAFDPGYTLSEVFYLDGSNLMAYGSPSSFRLFPSEYGLSVRNGFGYTIDIAVVDFVKLEPKKAYINQYSHAADWSYTYNTPTTLYDDDGNTIPYDSGKLYTLTASVKADGTIQTHTQWIEAVNVNGALGYRSGVSGNTCYFYYTVK